jgi:AcrR family transcriptional regulator
MSDTPINGKPAELARERRHQIFEAAARVFAAKGYHDATISEIAQEAGLGKGTIYEYVKSKKQLLYLVIEEGNDRMLAAMDMMLTLELPPEEKCRRTVQIMIGILDEYRDAARVLLPEIFGLELTDAEFSSTLKIKYISRMQKIYEEGVATGKFREMDSFLISELFLNILSLWSKSDTVRNACGESSKNFENILLDFFFKGIMK